MAAHPLTPDRWCDFEALLGKSGAYGGCWCMWWRLKRREFEAGQVSSFMGTPKMFEAAGFVECATPSKSKLVFACISRSDRLPGAEAAQPSSQRPSHPNGRFRLRRYLLQ